MIYSNSMISYISRKLSRFLKTLEIGFFLAFRQVRRASIWTTTLIIFVMVLTFLNLTVIPGILVGLIEGSVEAYRSSYSGDLIVSSLQKEEYIKNTEKIISMIEGYQGKSMYTVRYVGPGTIEAGYRNRTNKNEAANEAGTSITGINPATEDAVTGLASFVSDLDGGQYLNPQEGGYILIGRSLLKEYTNVDAPGFTALEGVRVGDRVRVKIGENTKEFTVKGILQSKVSDVEFRAYINDWELRQMLGRDDRNASEISIRMKEGIPATELKNLLVSSGFDSYAKIQTFEEALPQFLLQIKDTFALLGTLMGSISLVVACITIFIVIFINAVTRRKFIGILKGIGISKASIETAYVLQSLFYALIGCSIGMIILFGLLQPFIAAHPINFPFSDGILVAETVPTIQRFILLLVATVIAGFIPARLVARQNTLDAILGR